MEIINTLINLIKNPMDFLVSVPEIWRYVAVTSMIFAESGFLLGFVFPGDSLLLVSGILASQGYFNIWLLLPILFLAAVLGDNLGYYTGEKFGDQLMKREKWLFLKRQHLEKAKDFFDQKGHIAITLCRFVPAVRTFVPIVAGASRMDRKVFFKFNLLGGFLWAICITLIGYFFGKIIPAEIIDKYLTLIVVGIVLLSLIPIFIEKFKSNSHKSD